MAHSPGLCPINAITSFSRPLQRRRRKTALSCYPGNRQRTPSPQQLSEASSQLSSGPLVTETTATRSGQPSALPPSPWQLLPYPTSPGHAVLLLPAGPPRPSPLPPISKAPQGHYSGHLPVLRLHAAPACLPSRTLAWDCPSATGSFSKCKPCPSPAENPPPASHENPVQTPPNSSVWLPPPSP